MLVLALDTTTRQGSAALARGEAVVDCEIGDTRCTYGERLPGDLLRLLDRNKVRISDIELFAVAAGPGSFTGLRVGIATMQGLALANGRGLVGVSALDALNASVRKRGRAPFPGTAVTKKEPGPFFVGVLMDAHRGEVFSALYRGDALIDGPAVGTAAEALARWKLQMPKPAEPLMFIGDGAIAYSDIIARMLPDAVVQPDVPPLAPHITDLAQQQAASGVPVSPGAIRPIYVRRPDAELARDRKKKVPGSGCMVPGAGSGLTPKP